MGRMGAQKGSSRAGLDWWHDEGLGWLGVAREVVEVLIKCSGKQGHEQMYASAWLVNPCILADFSQTPMLA